MYGTRRLESLLLHLWLRLRFGMGGDAVGGENRFQSLFAEDLDSLEMGFAVVCSIGGNI